VSVLDFAALPPEVNSGRMYAGPGSGPMLAAAAAWDVLAVELESTAVGYSSVLSGLTGQQWSGAASAAMASAAAPYVAWLSTTAAQAEQTAIQAKAAAAAYEAAFAMTVPPPAIAANRATLLALIATNFFGQNFPAIAATEAHYAEMWAQDAAAMYSYAGSSAAASALAPFNEPPQTTDTAGQGFQVAAVIQAAGGAVGRPVIVPATTTSSTDSAGAGSVIGWIPLFGSTSLFGSTAVFGSQGFLGPTFLGASSTTYANQTLNLGFRANSQVNEGTRVMNLGVNWARDIDAVARFNAEQAAKALTAGLGSARPGSVTAGLGRAGLMGSLSVPPSWAGEPVAIRPTALALPGVGAGAVAAPAEPMPGSVFSQGLMSALSSETEPVHPKSKPVLVRNPTSERGGRVSNRS
jgi:PPE-repeat protein